MVLVVLVVAEITDSCVEVDVEMEVRRLLSSISRSILLVLQVVLLDTFLLQGWLNQ